MNEQVLNKYFENEQKIGVATSGGLDSVCLLFLCAKYAKKTNKQVVCMHVHHGLRKESDAELVFVENLAKKLGCQFVFKKVDVEKSKAQTKTTLEEAARNLRYEALSQMAEEAGTKLVCLAHHANDQAETVLLHLIRGSGLKGACGMSEVNGMFVRPLLGFTRNQLEEFAKKHKLEHVEDQSNADTNFSRNFLRHKVFPLLEDLQSGATLRLCAFASKMQQTDAYVQNNIPKLQQKSGEILLEDADIVLFSAMVHKACGIFGVYHNIEEKHICQIKNLFSKQNGAQIHLPHGLVAYKDNKGVVICLGKSHSHIEHKFKVGKFDFGQKIVNIKKEKTPNFAPNILFIDADKIPKNAVLRNPKEGDRFQKLGASGGKSLGDYFTDKKIALRKRKEYVVLASENTIYAVVSEDVSEKAKIDKTTKKIYKIIQEEK